MSFRGYDRRGGGGYGEGGARGGRGSYGTDPRERSPSRGRPQYDRSERREDYGRDRGPSQHRGRGSSSGHGYSTTSTSTGVTQSTPYTRESSEQLPALPASASIPQGKGSHFLGKPLQQPRGKSGRPTMVNVNHFAIESLPIVKILQYEIRMKVPPSSQRRGSEKVTALQTVKAMLVSQYLWGNFFIFDGVSLAWSTEELLQGDEEQSTVIDLPGHSIDRPNQIEITLKKTGKLNIRKLVEYLESGLAGLVSGNLDVDDVFKALNALFRDDPSKRLITFPKSSAYFSRVDTLCQPLASTAGVLEAMRGIHQSISFGFGRLALNIDTKCAAFYTPGKPMTEVAAAFCNVRNPAEITRGGCEESMIGIYFVIKHLDDRKNSLKRRIQKLSEQDALTKVFTVKNPTTGQEQETNVNDYFLKKYNKHLSYPKIPLLVTRDGLFPMELCFTAPGERYKQPLQGPQTADFIKFATSPAHVRQRQIMDNVKRLAHWTLPKPQAWGIAVSPHMLQTPAVVLPSPVLEYKSGPERDVARGSWNLRGKQFLRPQGFSSWGLVYFPGSRGGPSDREFETFCSDLCNSLKGHGLSTPRRPPAILHASFTGSNAEDVIRDIINRTTNTFGSRPELIVFFAHQSMPPTVYKACKKTCECLAGVASQFMVAEKALKTGSGRPQYLSNVAMKINAKLGGLNWRAPDPFFNTRKVMILGADSTHPSPMELRREMPPPSYGCLVGSLDSNCSSYSAVTVAQPATRELISEETISIMFKELLKRYQARNGGNPDTILFLRDGVSDNQVAQFLKTEVQGLQNVRNQLELSFKMTVVNCIKRHHTRFFPTDRQQADKLGNVVPCTVVANCQKGNDIYVVSQAALQGTCRPTHYVSVYDENDLDIDDFQRIILHGCFNYQRATRSVSLHSAVYYADQCAERAKLHLFEENGQLVLKDVDKALAHTMYWQ